MRKVVVADQAVPVLGLGTWLLGRYAARRNQEIEALHEE